MLTTKNRAELRALATSIAGDLADTVHHDISDIIDYYPYSDDADDEMYEAALTYFKESLIQKLKLI